MIRLLRYIKGYILFEAQGGFPERFLNLCKNHSIDLWSVENDGVKVKAYTDAKSYNRLEIPLKNSGMEAFVLKESGLLHLFKCHKWRCGAVFGLIMVVLIVWFMSGFIWEVEILDEKGVMVKGFTESLRETGVEIGSRKSKIDIPDVQNRLLARHKELMWVSVNIFGCKAQVEYTLVNEKTPSEDDSVPCNIVAEKNGRITLVECYRGTISVKEGAYVVKGSLLISGVVKNADLTEKTTHAEGKVFAVTENTINVNGKTDFKGYVTLGGQPCYILSFFGVDIPFGKKADDNEMSLSRTDLVGNNTVLPVGITRCDTFTLETCDVSLSPHQLKLILLKKVVDNKRNEYGSADIKKAVYSAVCSADKCKVTAKIRCVEDIAVKEPIFLERN